MNGLVTSQHYRSLRENMIAKMDANHEDDGDTVKVGGCSQVHVRCEKARGHGVQTELNLVFRVAGRVGERLVYRGEESGFEFLEARRSYAFDADGGLLRLASEAYRDHRALWHCAILLNLYSACVQFIRTTP